MNLKELDDEYEKLRRAIEAIGAAEARFQKEHGANGMSSPFDVHGLLRGAAELRERFIRFAVRLVRKALTPNVPVDPDKVRQAMDRELGPTRFSSDWIVQHIERTYASRQGDLALQHLREELQRRLPWVKVERYRSRRPECPEEAVKGRTLVLEVHLWDARYGMIARHEVPTILDALVKASRIAIERAAPESAVGVELPGSLLEARAPEAFFSAHELKDCPIESIRLLKLGAIHARYRSVENALKVAALILG
jgi:hypothetical protein